MENSNLYLEVKYENLGFDKCQHYFYYSLKLF